MGNALVPVGPVFEPEEEYEAYYEAHVDAIYDAYVDVLPADEEDAVETDLGEEDEEALEIGIASVFDTLRSEEPTFALLAELNRLWAQPLAA